MGRKRAASGMGFGQVPDGLRHRFDGRSFLLLLFGRLIDDRIEFGFRQAGFVGEQFEL